MGPGMGRDAGRRVAVGPSGLLRHTEPDLARRTRGPALVTHPHDAAAIARNQHVASRTGGQAVVAAVGHRHRRRRRADHRHRDHRRLRHTGRTRTARRSRRLGAPVARRPHAVRAGVHEASRTVGAGVVGPALRPQRRRGARSAAHHPSRRSGPAAVRRATPHPHGTVPTRRGRRRTSGPSAQQSGMASGRLGGRDELSLAADRATAVEPVGTSAIAFVASLVAVQLVHGLWSMVVAWNARRCTITAPSVVGMLMLFLAGPAMFAYGMLVADTSSARVTLVGIALLLNLACWSLSFSVLAQTIDVLGRSSELIARWGVTVSMHWVADLHVPTVRTDRERPGLRRSDRRRRRVDAAIFVAATGAAWRAMRHFDVATREYDRCGECRCRSSSPSVLDARRRPAVASGKSPGDTLRAMATPFPPLDGSAPQSQSFSEPPEMGIDPSKRYTATLDTSLGEIVIALDAVKAPKTVNNFVFLALHHYYDGVIFHRIINGFMCQGGDPTGTGTGGPGYRFEDELPQASRVPDRLGRDGQRRPEHQRQTVLPRVRTSGVGLPPQYSLFGQIVKGLDVLDTMQNVPTARGDRPHDDVVINSRHHHRIRLTVAGFRPHPSSHHGRLVGDRRLGGSRCMRRVSGEAADRPRRSTPSAPRPRPHRVDPDRLGQRARPQPGVAPVRAARGASADADPRCHRRRGAVRVLGARGLSRPRRAASAVPLADGQDAPLGACAALRERAPTSSTSCSDVATTDRSSPATSQRRGPKGQWWDWDDGKTALEYLFHTGAVTAYRRPNDFARVYDLTERVIPAEHPRPADAERDRCQEGTRRPGGAVPRDRHRHRPDGLPPTQPAVDATLDRRTRR